MNEMKLWIKWSNELIEIINEINLKWKEYNNQMKCLRTTLEWEKFRNDNYWELWKMDFNWNLNDYWNEHWINECSRKLKENMKCK